MARPTKQGLDYFALDVNMSDEVEIIEAEHGLVGFAILVKLFQKVYSEGYYYKWEDREQILFSSRINTDRNLLTSIVNDCIKWGIFDKELYETFSILTSRRIQNHYFIATYKRVGVEAIEEYLLIDVSDRKNVVTSRVSVDSNEPSSTDSVVESTQSKVEESRVEESRVDISDFTPVQSHYINTLENIQGYPLDVDKDIEYLKTLEDRYPTLDIIQAINKFSDYILDNPFRDNANHKSQLNNSFSKYLEWGICKKPIDTKNVVDDNPFINRS